MSTLSITQVYLESSQKKALQVRAKERGTKVSEEIRNAISAYLEGISVEELQLLDAASKHAGRELDAMGRTLKATNAKLDRLFAEVEKSRRANQP
jgi:plasmid stability protein